ncbi:hypothetical protein D3C86_1623370 [compost metagenome]
MGGGQNVDSHLLDARHVVGMDGFKGVVPDELLGLITQDCSARRGDVENGPGQTQPRDHVVRVLRQEPVACLACL